MRVIKIPKTIRGIPKIHQQHLYSVFCMKELGHLTYLLGLEVHTTSPGIFFNQHKYIQDLTMLADLCGASSVDNSLELNVKYRKDEGDILPDPTLYRELVGNLIYFTITRPDISLVDHTVSQFMNVPRHLHLVAIRRIIRHLIGIPHRGMFFPKGAYLSLATYSDADWVDCLDSRSFTTGWCIFLGETLISWKCKKQNCVSKCFTKDEYRTMSVSCSEILWRRGLLVELGVSQTQPTSFHGDNISTIQFVANLCITNIPNILKWIVIIFETPMIPKSSLFLMFLLLNRSQISS